MSRRNCLDGLVEHLRSAHGFDAVSTGTVEAHDHRVLGMGVDRAIVVLNNRAETTRLSMGGATEVNWYFDVEMYVRHNGDLPNARADSDTYVQAVMDRINADTTLGGSAVDAEIVEVNLIDEDSQPLRVGGLHFLEEIITVRVTEFGSYA